MRMDEKLIELVKQNPELYDLNRRQHSDSVHKKKVWNQIGSELNKTGPECKQRWTSLRNQHWKATNKSVISGRKWKYEDAMSFLVMHKKENRIQKLFSGEFDDEKDEDEEDIEIWEELSDPSMSTNASKRKVNQTVSTLLKCVLENKNEAQSAIDLIFQSMANTVKKFSPQDQHLVKTKIFQIVSEMEAKYIQSDQPQNNIKNTKVNQRRSKRRS